MGLKTYATDMIVKAPEGGEVRRCRDQCSQHFWQTGATCEAGRRARPYAPSSTKDTTPVMQRLNIVHLLANASFEAGGPSRSVLQLCRELGRRSDTSATLITGLVGSERLPSAIDEAVEAHIAHYRGRIGSLIANRHLELLQEELQKNTVDVVHLHSLWHPVLSRGLRLARHYGAVTVVSPRGTLEPWALQWHPRRKRMALRLYQYRDLKLANGFIATSDAEAESIRRLGLTQPVRVIPNGVDIQPEAARPRYSQVNPDGGHHRILLSLGRIHPKKGLVNLIQAWSIARPVGWVLHIAGIDEGGHEQELIKLAADLQLGDNVVFLGPVGEDNKATIFGRSSAFVLPSFSENFGNVVLEALSFGLPVIATRGTPWSSLTEGGCGWWVEPTVAALRDAVRALAGVTERDLQTMSALASLLAADFSWAPIASRVRDFYAMLLLKQSGGQQ
jgi:glycosyltransferase involved in cell wall biosynthesis